MLQRPKREDYPPNIAIDYYVADLEHYTTCLEENINKLKAEKNDIQAELDDYLLDQYGRI